MEFESLRLKFHRRRRTHEGRSTVEEFEEERSEEFKEELTEREEQRKKKELT